MLAVCKAKQAPKQDSAAGEEARGEGRGDGGDRSGVAEASPRPVLFAAVGRRLLARRLQRRHVHHARFGPYKIEFPPLSL